jgi:hypothetical protein
MDPQLGFTDTNPAFFFNGLPDAKNPINIIKDNKLFRSHKLNFLLVDGRIWICTASDDVPSAVFPPGMTQASGTIMNEPAQRDCVNR